MISHLSLQWLRQNKNQNLVLMGELWDVFCKDFWDNYLRNHGTTLYLDRIISKVSSTVNSCFKTIQHLIQNATQYSSSKDSMLRLWAPKRHPISRLHGSATKSLFSEYFVENCPCYNETLVYCVGSNKGNPGSQHSSHWPDMKWDTLHDPNTYDQHRHTGQPRTNKPVVFFFPRQS